jgi:hypothetical protein
MMADVDVDVDVGADVGVDVDVDVDLVRRVSGSPSPSLVVL